MRPEFASGSGRPCGGHRVGITRFLAIDQGRGGCCAPLMHMPVFGQVAALVAAPTRFSSRANLVPDASKSLIRKKLRARSYDYSSAGTYWVTICVHHMECRFGEVVEGVMRLNQAGRMVDDHWRSLPERYAFFELDAYVVMPNHFHGIVFLGTTTADPPVSLSAAIGAFKSLTTVDYSRGVREGRFPLYDRTLWQRSFQDRIVQSEWRLEDLRRYVEGNPGRWQEKRRSMGLRRPSRE